MMIKNNNNKIKFYNFIKRYTELDLSNKTIKYVADIIEESIVSKNILLPTITIIIIPPRTFKTTVTRLMILWLKHTYKNKKIGMLSYASCIVNESLRMINMIDKVKNMHKDFNSLIDILIYDECHKDVEETKISMCIDKKREEFLRIFNVNMSQKSSAFIFTTRYGHNDLVNYILNAGLGAYIKYINIKSDIIYPYHGYTIDGLYKTKRMLGEEYFNLLYNGVPIKNA